MISLTAQNEDYSDKILALEDRLAIYQATQLGDTRTGWTLIAISGLLALGLVLAATRLERS